MPSNVPDTDASRKARRPGKPDETGGGGRPGAPASPPDGEARSTGTGDRFLRIVSGLIPAAERAEICEEWHAWLADMRAERRPWHHRFLETASILVHAPALAAAVRTDLRRAAR